MAALIETLILPLQFPFMQKAMLIAALAAVPTALLSCFLVLKGWSLLGDAIAHAVLPGIVIAYIFGFPIVIGALVAGLVCAVSAGAMAENSRVKSDTILGVVFSGMFGLGLLLFSKSGTGLHLDLILFGDLLGTSDQDLIETGLVSLVVLVIIAAKWRDLMLFIFDPIQATALGLPHRWIGYAFLSLVAITIVGALKSVGVLLAIAMLIAPGAIAFLLTERLSFMLFLSILIAFLASFAGLYASFFLDSAPSATIVLVQTAIFMIALVHHRTKAMPKGTET